MAKDVSRNEECPWLQFGIIVRKGWYRYYIPDTKSAAHKIISSALKLHSNFSLRYSRA
jgi:hypothetical protein